MQPERPAAQPVVTADGDAGAEHHRGPRRRAREQVEGEVQPVLGRRQQLPAQIGNAVRTARQPGDLQHQLGAVPLNGDLDLLVAPLGLPHEDGRLSAGEYADAPLRLALARERQPTTSGTTVNSTIASRTIALRLVRNLSAPER